MERILLDQRKDGRSELQLWENWIDGQRELELVVNGVFIMATYNRISSELLIHHGLEKLLPGAGWDLLIGGLGMGFSVRQACQNLGVRRVDVVEIEAAVVDWNRKQLLENNGHCLEDPRVRVEQDDFYNYVMSTKDYFDLVAMDIDNGPMMLAEVGNQRVYSQKFFCRVKEILKPGGVFAVWSCNHAPELLEQGNHIFSRCTLETVYEEHQGKQVPYYLYFMSNAIGD